MMFGEAQTTTIEKLNTMSVATHAKLCRSGGMGLDALL
jgi:hypothetical protein